MNTLLRDLAQQRKQRQNLDKGVTIKEEEVKEEIVADQDEEPIQAKQAPSYLRRLKEEREKRMRGSDIGSKGLKPLSKDKTIKSLEKILSKSQEQKKTSLKPQEDVALTKGLGTSGSVETSRPVKNEGSVDVISEPIQRAINRFNDEVKYTIVELLPKLKNLSNDYAIEVDSKNYSYVYSIISELSFLLDKIHSGTKAFNSIIRELIMETKSASEVNKFTDIVDITPSQIKMDIFLSLDLIKGISETLLYADFSKQFTNNIINKLQALFDKAENYYNYESPEIKIDMDVSGDEELARQLQREYTSSASKTPYERSLQNRVDRSNKFDPSFTMLQEDELYPSNGSFDQDDFDPLWEDQDDFEISKEVEEESEQDVIPSRRFPRFKPSPPPSRKFPRFKPSPPLNKKKLETKEVLKAHLNILRTKDLNKLANRVYKNKNVIMKPPKRNRSLIIDYIFSSLPRNEWRDYIYLNDGTLLQTKLPVLRPSF